MVLVLVDMLPSLSLSCRAGLDSHYRLAVALARHVLLLSLSYWRGWWVIQAIMVVTVHRHWCCCWHRCSAGCTGGSRSNTYNN